MTEADLQRIETELEVRLPQEYREAMLEFPIRFLAGNADSLLWDDADSLIRQNVELRTAADGSNSRGSEEVGWPPRLLFIGGDVELSSVLDLRQPPCRVLEVDHWDVSAYEEPYEDAPTFTDWLSRYLDDYRKDGVDLASDEDPVSPVPKACACAAFAFILVTAGAGAVIWILKLLRGD